MDLPLQNEIRRRLESVSGSGVDLSLLLPELKKPFIFDPLADWDRRSELSRFGVELSGKPGAGNRLIFDQECANNSTKAIVHLFGHSGNLLIFDSRHQLAGTIRMEGKEQTFIIGPCPLRPFHSNSIIFRGDRTSVIIGGGTTSNGATLLLDGQDTCIMIGRDCMLSHGIEISASDSHCIFDIDTLESLPGAESIIIGAHVWIGSHVSINKGVTIGNGSIVGARSIVTRDMPAASLFAGSPARELRSRVSWTRERVATDEMKRRTIQTLT